MSLLVGENGWKEWLASVTSQPPAVRYTVRHAGLRLFLQAVLQVSVRFPSAVLSAKKGFKLGTNQKK